MSVGSGHPLAGPVNPILCPECGAVNFASATKCYLCGRVLVPAKEGRDRRRCRRRYRGRLRGPATYSLSTLFLFVTLACVCFALIAASPGLGIPVAVLVAPALVRTFVIARVQQSRGIKPSAEKKVGDFFLSLAIMLLIVVAAGFAFCAAFFVVCLTSLNSRGASENSIVIFSLCAGVVGALAAGILIFVQTWPFRRK